MSTHRIRRNPIAAPCVTAAVLTMAILLADARAQDAAGRAQPGETQRPKVTPKDLTDWKISIDLGPWGPERESVGWYEAAIDSDSRCRVVYVRREKRSVLFDEKLTARELADVLENACAAVSAGPPERMYGYWEDGYRVRLLLATQERTIDFTVSGLSKLLEDAGVEVQELIAIINRRLPRGRFWTEEQQASALLRKIDPKDVTEWRLSISLRPGVNRSDLGRLEITVEQEGLYRVERVRNRETTVVLDKRLSAEELRTVLERACAAVSQRPPAGMRGSGEEGQTIVLTFKTPMKTFAFSKGGLSPLLDGAGPAVQQLILAINGHLPAADRIWSAEEAKAVERGK